MRKKKPDVVLFLTAACCGSSAPLCSPAANHGEMATAEAGASIGAGTVGEATTTQGEGASARSRGTAPQKTSGQATTGQAATTTDEGSGGCAKRLEVAHGHMGAHLANRNGCGSRISWHLPEHYGTFASWYGLCWIGSTHFEPSGSRCSSSPCLQQRVANKSSYVHRGEFCLSVTAGQSRSAGLS